MRQLELVIGVLVFFLVAIAGIGVRKLGNYWDIPSLICVAGSLLAYFLIGPGISKTITSFKAINSDSLPSNDTSEEIVTIFRNAAFFSILSGILYTIVGIVNMCSVGMDDPNLLVRGFAIACLTIFWSTLIAMIFVACSSRINNLKTN